MSFLLLPSLENAFWLLGFRRCFPATDLVGDTEKNAQLESLFLTLDTHTRARARTHTHTHTYSVYCPSLHGDMPGFHIREPASPLPSRKVSWKPAETFLRPVRSWQLKLFNQHGDVISCSWCAWSFQEPRTL